MSSTATLAKAPAGNLNFVLICVFIDMLGIGLIVPVLPGLVGEFVHAREQQALWYGVLSATFGLMQFVFMPMVGAVSDRLGRRPVLLYSMAGMCINFLTTAWAPNLACAEAMLRSAGFRVESMPEAEVFICHCDENAELHPLPEGMA